MSFDLFASRHIGVREEDHAGMLEKCKVSSVEDLIDKTIPASIRLGEDMDMDPAMSEYQYLGHIRDIASKNKIYKTYIGQGYYNTILPPAILRNILENPGWYTPYTPYQAELSQGRLEALLNFQTMVVDLTGMEVANASLLDEGTAASEAMLMAFRSRPRAAVKAGANKFFVDEKVFVHTKDVLLSRAEPVDIDIVFGDYREFEPDESFFGALVQYPNSEGDIDDHASLADRLHDKGQMLTVVADLMSLVMLTPPGEWGADMVVGSTQRFGIPMGYGGPHAAYFATHEKYKRNLPGRIIGISVDSYGNKALRMALQTREQHIKRERASSNICTAQALLASMAGMYGVYHGPYGLKRIASHIHQRARVLEFNLTDLGLEQVNKNYFDTLKITIPYGLLAEDLQSIAIENELNLYYGDEGYVSISLDETTNCSDVERLVKVFAEFTGKDMPEVKTPGDGKGFDEKYIRQSEFLQSEVFNSYRSETEIMRYIKMLERKDISLTQSMISLGSCTMKLNAAAEMLPLSWPEFADIHPFVPYAQAEGYHQLLAELEDDLKTITGFSAVSFQPNSGAAGEYAGLSVIRAWHLSRGDDNRNVVLIPSSAHGTNPASGVMAGMKVVVVDCDEKGNIDLESLRAHAEKHSENLSAFMVTYPSTHGVFEEEIREMIDIIHSNGGQIYMDGANMNAQIGYTNPAFIGADVCHLNLHKTFAIPHGGGGPGMGPIAVAEHLAGFLPSHQHVHTGGDSGIKALASGPWGSASILTISHAYVKMMGAEGLKKATAFAILNANYMAARLSENYKILYTGKNGFVGHEMIVDCRPFKADSGVSELDIAKRLMDYGFHAPTLSFPVHGTLMVEPTESESKAEMDRFIEAMESIHREIMDIVEGRSDANDNALMNSPHAEHHVVANSWEHKYSRESAAYPLEWVRMNKFWPGIGRIDDAYGDRNLMCTCDPIESYREQVVGIKNMEAGK